MSSSNWYLLMIGAIFIAVIAFVFGTIVFGYESEQQAREVASLLIISYICESQFTVAAIIRTVICIVLVRAREK